MFEKKVAAKPNYQQKVFTEFAVDGWTTAELIAVRGFVKPGNAKFNTTDQPVVQFLFAGPDTNGEIVRRWTKEVNFKYGGQKQSNLEKLFSKIDLNSEDPVTGDKFLDGILNGDSQMWNANYDIYYEEEGRSKDGRVFNGITKVRFNCDAQNYKRTQFYDKKFVPFSYVSLYGGKVMCELQDVCAMTEEGFVHWTKDDFINKEA